MFVNKLFNKVLIEPAQKGATELFAVSGYASATFANRHLSEINNSIVNLIIGMPGRKSDHVAFEQLCKIYPNRFRAYYLEGKPPVHSKIYGWYKGSKAFIGFAGSANYSQPGFFYESQINQISNENPKEIKTFFESLLSRSVRIQDTVHEGIPEIVDISTVRKSSILAGDVFWEIPNKRVRISFLTKKGRLPQRSGLNWGQRPEEGREPNQAYLPIRADARKINFLPPKAFTFTLLTDDGKSIDCAIAQEGRKAIHSNRNNSEIGIYIRNRIGVPSGHPITVEDLIKYGRTDFTIQKITDETFLLDLSVK
ncbi:MAG: NgoFVII family restriction endonuclease [Bacteroidota bacterium]|nr:NgoFVII family restriction endonuclease [Bacteroidota bacterium]